MIVHNDQGFVQAWNQYSICLQLLLIENILMKLKTKVDCCLSRPNHSLFQDETSRTMKDAIRQPNSTNAIIIGRFYSLRFNDSNTLINESMSE